MCYHKYSFDIFQPIKTLQLALTWVDVALANPHGRREPQAEMTSVLFSAPVAPVANMDAAQQQQTSAAAAAAPSSQQPRMLAQYQVLQTLGSGLQGKVKLGVDTVTHQRVALKVIDMAKLHRKAMINVYREVEAMSRVSHSNVLRLLSVHDDVPYPKKDGSSKQVIVIVLELATGGELFDFMMYTGCFSENIARAYFQQLVAGLEACHAQGCTTETSSRRTCCSTRALR